VIRFEGRTEDLLSRPDLVRSVFLAGAEPVPEHEPVPEPVPEYEQPSVGRAPGRATDGWSGGRADVVLATEHLAKRFAGVMALDDVSIELRQGEILGLIGPNGAGKTTLFDLVSGFLVADEGRVLLRGRDLAGLRPAERARLGLARSFQNSRIFPSLTVHQTLCVALDDELRLWDPVAASLHLPNVARTEQRLGARADELLETMGLNDFRDKFVADLSTGSRRIVDLACQIGAQPSVILLDEPSAGIAQRETEALVPVLLRVRDLTGASLLLIEHDLPLVTSVSDRVVALDVGRVLSEGDAAHVVNDPSVVESYLGTNARVSLGA
jgi:branched-chain amino acid transport system ATP-binding protein